MIITCHIQIKVLFKYNSKVMWAIGRREQAPGEQPVRETITLTL